MAEKPLHLWRRLRGARAVQYADHDIGIVPRHPASLAHQPGVARRLPGHRNAERRLGQAPRPLRRERRGNRLAGPAIQHRHALTPDFGAEPGRRHGIALYRRPGAAIQHERRRQAFRRVGKSVDAAPQPDPQQTPGIGAKRLGNAGRLARNFACDGIDDHRCQRIGHPIMLPDPGLAQYVDDHPAHAGCQRGVVADACAQRRGLFNQTEENFAVVLKRRLV